MELKDKNRYSRTNLHLIKGEDWSLIYHVLSNRMLKIDNQFAELLSEAQENEISDELFGLLNHQFENSLQGDPEHSDYSNTGHLKKLTMILTTMCNLRCIYCYADHGTYDGYGIMTLTEEDAKRILGAFVENGINSIDEIMFFGGEPLLAVGTIDYVCKSIDDLVRTGVLKKLPEYSMVTNLTIMNDSIKSMIEKYSIRVTASIDGPQEIHDLQRRFANQQGSWETTDKNARKIGSLMSGVEVTYTKNHALMGMTKNSVREYIAERYHINHTGVAAISVEGCPDLSAGQMNIDDIIQEDPSYDDLSVLSALQADMQSDLFCDAGHTILCVLPNGDVYPCHMFVKDRKYCLGNLLSNPRHVLNKDIALPLGRKCEEVNCRKCWARRFCSLCPAKLLLSDMSKEKYLSEEMCNARKLRYEKMIRFISGLDE